MKRKEFKKPKYDELEKKLDESIEEVEDLISRLQILKTDLMKTLYGHDGYGFDDEREDDNNSNLDEVDEERDLHEAEARAEAYWNPQMTNE